MRKQLFVIAGLLIVAMFGSALAAEARGARFYFSFGSGPGYGALPAWGHYPGCEPYYYPGYYSYRSYYPPPFVYRTYAPYRYRVYREYAPYYRHYDRGPRHYAPPRRYIRR